MALPGRQRSSLPCFEANMLQGERSFYAPAQNANPTRFSIQAHLSDGSSAGAKKPAPDDPLDLKVAFIREKCAH